MKIVPPDSPLASDHAARCLVTDAQGRDEIDTAPKRQSTIEKQIALHEAIATPSRVFDAVDLEIEAMDQAGPWDVNLSSRRKESEVRKLLDLLDNLPRGKDSDEG